MMTEHYLTHKRVLIFIIVLYVFSLFLHLDRIPLKFEEPRRGLVALEMMESGNYIVPTINGINYYNKPPVFNWVLIGFFKLTGSTEEWVVRLPTTLSLLAIAAIVFVFTARYLSRKMGLFAALFWLTSADIYFHYSIVGEIDIFFTLLVVLQVLSIFHFYKKEQYFLLFLCSYVFMSIGVLTKGLPSIAFQALTFIALSITYNRWKWLFYPVHFLSLLAPVIIIGGYFYVYSLHEDVLPFLVNLFIESSDRTPISNGVLRTIMHFLVFPFLHFKLFLPWLLMAGVMYKKERWDALFKSDILRFAFYFCLLNVIPYWISPGTRDRYLYPFIPFVMIGAAWTYIKYYGKSRIEKWMNGVMFAFIFLFALLPFTFPQFEELGDIKWLWFKGLIFVVVFVLLGVAFIKLKHYRIWIFFMAFICARILFDFTIIPAREYDARKNKRFESSAKDIAAISRGEQVFWLSNKTKLRQSISVPGVFEKEVVINEPVWADFTLSYYFTKYHSSILEYTEQFDEGKYHLVLPSMLNEMKDYEIIKEYFIPKKDETYILIK